jgi:hypothetical protein
MKRKNMVSSKCLALAAAAFLVATCFSSHGQSAAATISAVPVSGGFDYTIILRNSGGTSLNSFWYGWTTSGNNLSTDPTNAANSLGWGNTLDGNSIQWANTGGTAIAPGGSGTFTFYSTETPTAITTAPSGESVAYVHQIDSTEGILRDSTPGFYPALLTTPEPSPGTLFGFGLIGLTAIGWRRRGNQRKNLKKVWEPSRQSGLTPLVTGISLSKCPF